MSAILIKALLWLLNSRWLNKTPCKYGFINNLEAFSYENLASEETQRPGIMVKQVLEETDRFKSCSISKNGLTVIDGDEIREATVWDHYQLRKLFAPKGDNLK
jgi:hypothetical protein